MKRLYYLRNYYPKEGTIVTRIEFVDVPEVLGQEKTLYDTEILPGFQEWCK